LYRLKDKSLTISNIHLLHRKVMNFQYPYITIDARGMKIEINEWLISIQHKAWKTKIVIHAFYLVFDLFLFY